MRSLSELSDAIAEFPGIGPRQARRVAQFLLSQNQTFRTNLARLIQTVSEKVTQCSQCFRYDEMKNKVCSLCTDTSRDTATLMVVEKDVDIEGIEASSAYRGMYFVIGGLLSMARQRKNSIVRMSELMTRIQMGHISEVIVALSTTPEGDYTAHELVRDIERIAPTVKSTLLGRGLSVGAEIEYADSETLKNALKNRA